MQRVKLVQSEGTHAASPPDTKNEKHSLPPVSVLACFHVVDKTGYTSRNRSNCGALLATCNRADPCSGRSATSDNDGLFLPTTIP